MKAVNLIPEDLRGVQPGGPARTGIAPYVVLGVLGALVVFVSLWAFLGKQVTDKQADTARVSAEADAAEAKAGGLVAFTKVADARKERLETVGGIARSRFNWPHALREVSRTLPRDVFLTQMVGTVAPGVTVDGGGGGAASGLRQAVPSPALELTGCTSGHSEVAELMASLRSVEGVTRVALADSEKPEDVGSTTGDTSCQKTTQWPKFDIVVFFEASTATPSTGAPGTAPAAAPASSSSQGTAG